MAEKILNTRILLKIDTLENWNSSTLKIKKGELCLATVAASVGTGLEEPVVMVKVGTGEDKTFAELPWAFHAKASDVLSCCKTEAGLKAFVNNVIAEAGIATDEALTALAGRVGTAEGKITTLEGKMTTAEGKISANETAIAGLKGLVGDSKVADQINTAITNLNLATTYEAKGEAAKVQTALNEYKTSNDAAVQKNASDISAEVARAKAAEEANTAAINAIKDGTSLDSFKDVEEALAGKETLGAAAQALVDAKAYADGLAGNYDAKGSAATAESNAKAYAKEYADGLAGNYDVAGAAAAAEAAAKKYTDEEIVEWVGDKKVGVQISETIANYSTTAQMNSAIATAKGEAVSHANGLNTAMNARVEALEAIDHDHSNKAELDKIVVGDKAKWDAMEQNAKDYADGLNTAMNGRVADLEAMFGDGEGTVESQIEAAVAAETKLREEAVAAEAKLREEGDAALQEQITSNDEDIAGLKGLVGDKKVSVAIEEAITAEKNRAEGIEGGLETRLAAVEADYLKAADKTALENKIKSNADAIELLTNGVDAETVDGVNDLIQYVKDHGTEVTGMKKDIKDNADAIDAIEADYLKSADKTELQNQITANDGDISALQTAVGTKAAQSDLEALAGRVTTAEGKVSTLEGEMDTAQSDINTLKSNVGDKKVSVAIGEAIDALKNGQLTTMQGEIDDVEGRVEALEAIDHDHSNKTVLDGITSDKVTAWDSAVQTVTPGTGLKAVKTGTDVAISFDDNCVFIFDCGTSEE